jgi:opacity protein-like surface antigen
VHFIIKLTLTLTLCFSFVATARAGDSYQSYESYHRQNSDFSSYEPKQSELPFDSDYDDDLDNGYGNYSRNSISRYSFDNAKIISDFGNVSSLSAGDGIAFEVAVGHKFNNNFRLELQTEFIIVDDGKLTDITNKELESDLGSVASSINIIYETRLSDIIAVYVGGGGGYSQISIDFGNQPATLSDDGTNTIEVVGTSRDETTHHQYILGGKIYLTERSGIDFAYQHREIGDLDFGDFKAKDLQAKSFRIGYSVDF